MEFKCRQAICPQAWPPHLVTGTTTAGTAGLLTSDYTLCFRRLSLRRLCNLAVLGSLEKGSLRCRGEGRQRLQKLQAGHHSLGLGW